MKRLKLILGIFIPILTLTIVLTVAHQKRTNDAHYDVSYYKYSGNYPEPPEKVAVINSLVEFNDFYSTKDDLYRFNFVRDRSGRRMADEIFLNNDKYNEAFFEDNFLLLIHFGFGQLGNSLSLKSVNIKDNKAVV